MNTEKGICYKCGAWTYTEEHHVFHGTANRKIADREGLTVYVCRKCHELIHRNVEEDLKLEREAQGVWEEHYMEQGHTAEEARAEFMRLFGKNYIY